MSCAPAPKALRWRSVSRLSRASDQAGAGACQEAVRWPRWRVNVSMRCAPAESSVWAGRMVSSSAVAAGEMYSPQTFGRGKGVRSISVT